VSEKKLKKWQEAAQQASAGSALDRNDHREAANPYLSLYGATWTDDINKSAIMTGIIFIAELMWYMKDEGDRVMEGTF
jgi:hypothetical protein